MNRLIILGNGFDLAHGLPTRYSDFMLHYLKDVFKNQHDTSGLIDIQQSKSFQDSLWSYNINKCKTINRIFQIVNLPNDIITYKIKSKLLEKLLKNFNDFNWVDIEAEYYRFLKECFQNPGEYDIKELNKDFEALKSILGLYLKKEVVEKYNFRPSSGFLDIFTTKKDSIKKPSAFSTQNEYPEKTVFLNFNYTPLIEYYFTQPEIIHHLSDHEVNYIHGDLENFENPIIFGFGDEKDNSYQEIEELNNNDYFEHIKSFQYSKTSNYQDLIRFLDGSSGGYEIYIIGHSCGLSDRTLLNHVFEHDNCKSIKIFYHNGIKGYTNTVYEISRHFENKASMRTKIVPFDKSLPTPKIQLKIKSD